MAMINARVMSDSDREDVGRAEVAGLAQTSGGGESGARIPARPELIATLRAFRHGSPTVQLG